MSEAEYSPLKEFVHDWWAAKVKPFLDFKSYLAQRRRILSDPQLILTTPIDGKVWKSPLKFAIQGLVVPALVASLLVGVHSFFIPKASQNPGDGIAAFDERIAQLRALEKEIEATDPEWPYSLGSRDDALRDCRQGIAALEARRWIVEAEPFVVSAVKKLDKLVAPIMLILAAFAFRWLLASGQGRTGTNIRRAREVYLYFVTSSVFWTGLIYTTLLVLLDLSLRAGLSAAAAVYYCAALLFGVVSLVLANRDCKKLQALFSLPLLQGPMRRTSGHHKIFSSIFFANALSFVATIVLMNIAAWVWGVTAMFIERLRA